jgi:hypothetical protein
MSSRFKIVPAASIKATVRGRGVFFIHMQIFEGPSNTNSIP